MEGRSCHADGGRIDDLHLANVQTCAQPGALPYSPRVAWPAVSWPGEHRRERTGRDGVNGLAAMTRPGPRAERTHPMDGDLPDPSTVYHTDGESPFDLRAPRSSRRGRASTPGCGRWRTCCTSRTDPTPTGGAPVAGRIPVRPGGRRWPGCGGLRRGGGERRGVRAVRLRRRCHRVRDDAARRLGGDRAVAGRFVRIARRVGVTGRPGAAVVVCDRLVRPAATGPADRPSDLRLCASCQAADAVRRVALRFCRTRGLLCQ